MNHLRKLVTDFLGLIRICGADIAFRWMIHVITHIQIIIQNKNLQPADKLMGSGPFTVRFARYGVSFRVLGSEAISGIREMYVRDNYLNNGTLNISDGDTVLDLGANMGNFTNLALSFGKNVKVIAIEPNIKSNTVFRQSIGLNEGYPERVNLIRAFIGGASEKQQMLMRNNPSYSDAQWISEDQLIHEGQLSRIDLLKCDIEGGEYSLLGKDSKLLSMTRQLAIEIHSFAGNVEEFIQSLQSLGFSVLSIKRDPDGTATVLAKRIQ